LTDGVIYEAKVTRVDNNQSEFYTGVTVGPFKSRYYGRSFDLRLRSQRSSTCLSKYLWGLKDLGIPYNISWKIIARGRGFNPTTRSCQACPKEKYFIMFRPEGATIDARTEFYTTCRHGLKLLLGMLSPKFSFKYDTLQDWRTIYVPKGSNSNVGYLCIFTIPKSEAMYPYE
jgi:hypothetical protein